MIQPSVIRFSRIDILCISLEILADINFCTAPQRVFVTLLFISWSLSPETFRKIVPEIVQKKICWNLYR